MDLSDIELAAMARTLGDERAFATLVRRHQARLRAFLHRLCGDGFLADDIAQETFLKAHRALATFKGGGSFRSWLYAIAYREFLQDRRRAQAAARVERALETEAARQPDADRTLEASLSLDLRRALAALEEMERAAILLCDAAGLSHAEAAAAIGAPLGSIKTYVARARRKMRAALTAEKRVCANPEPASTANGALYAV